MLLFLFVLLRGGGGGETNGKRRNTTEEKKEQMEDGAKLEQQPFITDFEPGERLSATEERKKSRVEEENRSAVVEGEKGGTIKGRSSKEEENKEMENDDELEQKPFLFGFKPEVSLRKIQEGEDVEEEKRRRDLEDEERRREEDDDRNTAMIEEKTGGAQKEKRKNIAREDKGEMEDGAEPVQLFHTNKEPEIVEHEQAEAHNLSVEEEYTGVSIYDECKLKRACNHVS